jgi:pimeloyl-ACP methyl ester carboxylesterase
MARSVDRATVMVAKAIVVGMLLSVLHTPLAAVAQESCPDPENKLPVILVHGFNSSPSDFERGVVPLPDVIERINGVIIDRFDYADNSDNWVKNPAIGDALAARIVCLADRSASRGGPGKVAVIGHSMGGLAIRQAASIEIEGRPVAERLTLVATIGTPHHGSWLIDAATLGFGDQYSGIAFRALYTAMGNGCRGSVASELIGICGALRDAGSEAAQAMRPGSPDLADLPPMPSTFPVLAAAGQAHVVADLFGRRVRLTGSVDVGDLLVRVPSATAASARPQEAGGVVVRECDLDVSDLLFGRGWTLCAHGGLLTDTAVQNAIVAAVQAALRRQPLTTAARVGIRGIGPIMVGMTVEEASRAARVAFDISGFTDFEGLCYYAEPRGFQNLALMVQAPTGESPTDPLQGEIVRVELRGPPWLTLSGVGVSSSVSDVERTYGSRLRVDPHEYQEGGIYLTFEGVDPPDRGFGVRFVSGDGSRIDSIYAGEIGAIQLVEGCA